MQSLVKKNRQIVFMIAPGVIAGAEKVVLTGLDALEESGLHPFIVIIKEKRAPLLAENFIKALPQKVKYHVIETHKAIDFDLPKKLAAFIQNNFKDSEIIFHTHGFKALIVAALCKIKKKHVHTHHGNTGHTLKVVCYELLALLFMRFTNGVVAVSQKMKSDLKKSLFPFFKITTIENMLSFKNVETLREIKKATINTKINLVYIGRISPEKGLIAFIHAFKNVAHPDHFKVTVLGDGPDKTDAISLVKKNQLESHFSFLGFVDQPGHYLAQADFLIMPSLTEGLPMTLIESLSVGIPVIANDVGAISELVLSNNNGKIIPFGKGIDSEYEWIQFLNKLPQVQDVLKKNAQNQALSVEVKFSAKDWVIKTIALYNKI